MDHIATLRTPPPNLDVFVAEIAAGLETLYGASAAQDYRGKAPQLLTASLRHPSVRAWAARDGHEAAALLLGIQRGSWAEIPLLHVLRRHCGTGLESDLLAYVVDRFRRANVRGILCECLPVTPVDLRDPFERLGFETVERQLMQAALDAPALTEGDAPASAPIDEADWPEAAACIVDAYRNHPGRRLHAEVQDLLQAAGYLARVSGGAYGFTRPEYLRRMGPEDASDGVVLGCQVAPEVGFVLQLAVRRETQNQGLGAALLRDLAGAFRAAGLDRIALGVTRSNPARRLYERLGFEVMRLTEAYTWWRE